MNLSLATLGAVAVLLATSAFAHPAVVEICHEAETDACGHHPHAHNSPNRYYFDPRFGNDKYDHVQFLRPWMAEAGWFISWATSPGLADGHAPEDIADVLFFSQDQQELPRGDRAYSVWLDIEKSQSRGLSGIVLYHAWFFFPAVGSEQCATASCGAGLDARRVGETNQWRFRLGAKRGMSSDLFVVGLHGMLDCLEQLPVSPADYERCDFVVDFDTLGRDATRNLNAAPLGTD